MEAGAGTATGDGAREEGGEQGARSDSGERSAGSEEYGK